VESGALLDFYANPSSQNSLGKKTFQKILEVESYLLETFNLSNLFDCIFHSGSTEGINLIAQGVLKSQLDKKVPVYFLYSNFDHACVRSQVPYLESLGVICKELIFPLEDYNFNGIKSFIKKIIPKEAFVFINLNWVHNETGFIFDVSKIEDVKDLQVYIHLDATQSIGKIDNFLKLPERVDSFTYSGHKFGSLKGIGWSFLKRNSLHDGLTPLFFGGGQQKKVRPGTYNTHGIISLELALRDVVANFDTSKMRANISLLRKFHQELVTSDDLVSTLNYNKPLEFNLNTVLFLFKKLKTQDILPLLDQNGILVGTGAACSSGTFQKNSFLESLCDDDLHQRSIRVSLGLNETRENVNEVLKVLKKTIEHLKTFS